jgi:ligand-binding SRPBCC domain-containing protein
MPLITIETSIQAPIELCFDLARDIDLHLETTVHIRERAVAGITTGLIGLGESVTFEARHFGVKQRLTVRITEFQRPYHFVDEMTAGPFKRLRHLHDFEAVDNSTLMIDTFEYVSPFSILGRIADKLFLERYMQRLLQRRMQHLKQVAEARTREPIN